MVTDCYPKSVSTENTLTFLAIEGQSLDAHFARTGVTLPGVMMLLLLEG